MNYRSLFVKEIRHLLLQWLRGAGDFSQL